MRSGVRSKAAGLIWLAARHDNGRKEHTDKLTTHQATGRRCSQAFKSINYDPRKEQETHLALFFHSLGTILTRSTRLRAAWDHSLDLWPGAMQNAHLVGTFERKPETSCDVKVCVAVQQRPAEQKKTH